MPNKLPASLEAKPNIHWSKQTLEQLREERDYWQSKIDDQAHWGGALAAAAAFRDKCEAWIAYRLQQQERKINANEG